jgi:endonuclease/exonuclease/phosphatase family metal-dependent hydrolase
MTPGPSLKLVCLNIERSKHLDLVVPFLKSQSADMVCLQELMEYDIPRFESELGMHSVYAGEKFHQAEGRQGVVGNGIFSRLPIIESRIGYYVGSAEHMALQDMTDVHTKHATQSSAVLFCDIEEQHVRFSIATTHFTWTPDGKPDDYQRADMKKMLDLLSRAGKFVLCGDFNASRGGGIFAMLADRYKDNIPPEYRTSVDISLHRAGKDRPEELADKMVDGLFTTAEYVAQDVQLHTGISDHMAITATISRS